MRSKHFWPALLFLATSVLELSFAKDVSKSKVLSRKKRYVAFPEGSSFSCACCMVVGLIGQPAPQTAPGTYTFALNWGIAYELPNATETISFYHKKYKLKKPMIQRRNRRDLYGKLETIMDKYDFLYSATWAIFNMGYDGRQCILKTLCETTQRLVPHGGNMVEEMFRTLFTLPMTRILPAEPAEHAIYDAAHRLGALLDNCDIYKCPISLVDLAQGYYNAPSPKDISNIALKPWSLFSSRFG